MSVGYQAWVIPPDYVAKLYGMRNEDYFNRLSVSLHDRLIEIGDRFSSEIACGAVPVPTQALRDIIDGRYPSGVNGAIFAYVLEAAVDLWGRFQPNAALMPSGLDLPPKVDSALASMGVDAFRLSMLSGGDFPCPVPPVADFPGFGYLTNAQLHIARAQFETARYEGDQATISAAITCIRGWVLAATRRKTTGLVGFFH
jgi:hypothetical protein